MISTGKDDKIYVHWVQNGIRNKKPFRTVKEAERFQELVNDLQNSIKLCEETEKLNRDINYDPKIVNLKVENLGKEIEELKQRLKIKQALQKKLGDVAEKVSNQPRNVIDRESFFKEIKQLKSEINRLDRFFKEHAIVSLHRQLQEAVKEMKSYFAYQKESLKETEDIFEHLKKELISKFSSITTKDKVLSIKETAKYLGVSYATVQSMMFTRKLPFFQVGNRYRIKENGLIDWLEKQKKKNKSQID